MRLEKAFTPKVITPVGGHSRFMPVRKTPVVQLAHQTKRLPSTMKDRSRYRSGSGGRSGSHQRNIYDGHVTGVKSDGLRRRPSPEISLIRRNPSSSFFDDDQLSTSKNYFSILAYTQQFRSSIINNISQWSLYYKARIEPFREDHTPELKALVTQVEESCSSFEVIKRQIDVPVETVKGRSDGLFNASALSETRITNRLGQNVKLLTYVSIFYLPLAFCAPVWAIPNVDMTGTKTGFSVTALLLGRVNFFVVANVGNLSRFLGGIYKVWRTRIMQQPKDDPKGNMNQMGRNLENS